MYDRTWSPANCGHNRPFWITNFDRLDCRIIVWRCHSWCSSLTKGIGVNESLWLTCVDWAAAEFVILVRRHVACCYYAAITFRRWPACCYYAAIIVWRRLACGNNIVVWRANDGAAICPADTTSTIIRGRPRALGESTSSWRRSGIRDNS